MPSRPSRRRRLFRLGFDGLRFEPGLFPGRFEVFIVGLIFLWGLEGVDFALYWFMTCRLAGFRLLRRVRILCLMPQALRGSSFS